MNPRTATIRNGAVGIQFRHERPSMGDADKAAHMLTGDSTVETPSRPPWKAI